LGSKKKRRKIADNHPEGRKRERNFGKSSRWGGKDGERRGEGLQGRGGYEHKGSRDSARQGWRSSTMQIFIWG